MAGGMSPSKIDQFITEFFAKVLHVILEARVPALSSQIRDSPASSSSSSFGIRSRSRDRWFNLVLGDCPAAAENIQPWKQNYARPMVIDVLLVRTPGWLRTATSGGPDWSGQDGGEDSTNILERWIVSFESLSSRDFMGKEGIRSRIDSGVYKRAIILIRSLYCIMRMLPAHRLFHLASSTTQNKSFSLSFRVSATPPELTPSEQASMMCRNLTPVDAQIGRLCVSVYYRHTTTVTALEVTPPILPRIITDYVGSPTTDPLRRVSSESLTGSVPSGGISGRRGVFVVSLPSSSSNSPNLRRHSWGGKAFFPPPSSSPSPPGLSSPLVNSPRSFPLRISSQPIPIEDRRRWSPTVPSSSLSPSPPGTSHPLESSLNRYRHSAPVNIPRPSSGLRGAHDRNALPPPSPRRTVEHRHFSEPNAPRLSISTLADSLLFISPPRARQADDNRPPDDGPPSGVRRSLYGSSRITLSRSRSSSKITSDDVDDDPFACPFAVDDDETDELRTRPGSPSSRNRSLEASGPRSKEAAVGALVRLLKTAPLLHEQAATTTTTTGNESPGNMIEYTTTRSKSRPVPGSHRLRSGDLRTEQQQQQQQQGAKVMGQALDELRRYREMREFLLIRQGGRKCTEKQLPSRSKGVH